MIVSLVLGIVTAGLAAAVMMRRGRKGHLADHERRELTERCIALGIPRDEVEMLVANADDHTLIARHRAEHRMLNARKGPFR